MKYDNVKFGEDCRSKLIEGVNLVTDAVACTYGPNGKNVVIKTPAGVSITKDGSKVASMVNDPDPYIMMGVEIIRDISKKTSKDVGDGSSTSCILSREIINTFKENENPIAISRKLSEDCEVVIKELQNYKKEVSSKEDLIKVATISANNDESIGKLIAEAFDHVGKDGIVDFEISDDIKDHIEYSQGFRINSGFASQRYINTPKGTCELENVMIHISDIKMEEVNDVVKLADAAVRNNKSLLLIAPEYDSEITLFLASNQSMLKSCAIISPEFKRSRETILDDIRVLLKTMECSKVIVTDKTTTFIGFENNSEEVNARIEEIREILANPLPEYDANFHKQRLANFTSGIATIYVGGYSKVEIKERYDRIEDAVCATKAALQKGILPGGGLVLKEIANKLDIDHNFKQILKTPSIILNTENKTLSDMIDLGVIEPVLVTETVLRNAVSTASLLLTADAAILNVNF